MSRSLTAQDRDSLVRLASSLPAGSPERKAILAGLSKSAGSKELDLLNRSELADYEEVTLRRVKGFEWQAFSLDGVVHTVDVRSVVEGDKTFFTESEARKSGTTLAKLIEFLENSGAKRVTEGLGPGASKPSAGSKELDMLERSELADFEEVTLQRVKRFKWQVFSRNGVVHKVVVHSVGLDGGKASFTESDARASRTSLANLIEFLEKAGAKRVTKGLGPARRAPSMFSQYD